MNGLDLSSSLLLLFIEDPKAKIIRIMHIIEPRTPPHAHAHAPDAASPRLSPASKAPPPHVSPSPNPSSSDELLDRTAFSRPDSLSEATSRLRRNLGYFCVNYATVVAFSLAASLLAHPFSLVILLSILGAWCFPYVFRASDQPVVLFDRTFTDRETLLGLVVASVLAFFLTSVASLIISGLLVGGAIVAVHGAFRMPEDLFLDDPSAGSNGNPTNRLLSFLASPGSGV